MYVAVSVLRCLLFCMYTMTVFTGMSLFLCLGVCFLYVYNDCFYGYVVVSVFRCLTLVCVCFTLAVVV